MHCSVVIVETGCKVGSSTGMQAAMRDRTRALEWQNLCAQKDG